MADYSFVYNSHPNVIEKLYEAYKNDPESVEKNWEIFFNEFDKNTTNGVLDTEGKEAVATSKLEKEFEVLSIIHGFRDQIHLLSTTNPNKQRKERKPYLEIKDYNLEESDLD